MKITNPHDAFFEETFSKREYAADFLAGVLPIPLTETLGRQRQHPSTQQVGISESWYSHPIP